MALDDDGEGEMTRAGRLGAYVVDDGARARGTRARARAREREREWETNEGGGGKGIVSWIIRGLSDGGR